MTTPETKHRHICFPHGLGDFVNFAASLPLYTEQGWTFDVYCAPDRQFMLDNVEGVTAHAYGDAPPDTPVHHWPEAHNIDDMTKIGVQRHYAWCGDNKPFMNLGLGPMPTLDGDKIELCRRYADISQDYIFPPNGDNHLQLAKFPRPHILVHTYGRSVPESKYLQAPQAIQLIQRLADLCPGTIFILDDPGVAPKMPPDYFNHRVRYMHQEVHGWPTGVAGLLSVLHDADLLVAVDSGPLQLVRRTKTPAVGIWSPGRHPSAFVLPRRLTLNVVPKSGNEWRNVTTRATYNIVELPIPTPLEIARVCAKVLNKNTQAVHLGATTQRAMASFNGEALDRHHGFRAMFHEASAPPDDFNNHIIIETGCIRREEDWTAGYSTYLFGLFARYVGGKLLSMDYSEANCAFARQVMAEFGDCVEIQQTDSVAGLTAWATAHPGISPLIVYLDSKDTDDVGHAEHNLLEFKAIEPALTTTRVVAIDDTWYDTEWRGKGALTVPYMLERQWKLIYAGHQAVLIPK